MGRFALHLALIQILLILLGFAGVAGVLKLSGYPGDFGLRWNPIAVAFRHHSLLLLLVPCLWAIFASIAARYERGLLSSNVAQAIGVGLVVVCLGASLFAVVVPYKRSLVTGISQKRFQVEK